MALIEQKNVGSTEASIERIARFLTALLLAGCGLAPPAAPRAVDEPPGGAAP